MNNDMDNFLFIMAGSVMLYVGLKWKTQKDFTDFRIVHKYTLIVLGSMAILYGIVSIL